MNRNKQLADNQQNTTNKLTTEPVFRLLWSLALPAIAANGANAAYHIIDQALIGNRIGYLGNAALAVAFPVTTICLALGLMIGVGGSASGNLAMGEGKKEEAGYRIGGGVTLLVAAGVVFAVLLYLFREPILHFFGGTGENMPMALDYTAVFCLGIPFLVLTTGLSALVRADRGAVYVMLAVLAGVAATVALDWVLLFHCDALGIPELGGSGNMGITGPAWANLVGQGISAVMLLLYLPRYRSLTLHKTDFLPRWESLRAIAILGFPTFIYQIATMTVQIASNQMLRKYGALSPLGSEVPLAVAGITGKLNMVYTSLIIGVVQGSQPITSVNYGSGNYKRVQETLSLLLTICFTISIGAWIVFEVFPRQLIQLFGERGQEYLTFAVRYLRIYMLAVFLNGVQIAATTFYPAIGKPKQGILLSLTRQVFFFLPMLYLFPLLWKGNGIIFAAPAADTLAFLVATLLLRRTRQKLRLHC